MINMVIRELYLQPAKHLDMRQCAAPQRRQFIATLQSRYDATSRMLFGD